MDEDKKESEIIEDKKKSDGSDKKQTDWFDKRYNLIFIRNRPKSIHTRYLRFKRLYIKTQKPSYLKLAKR